MSSVFNISVKKHALLNLLNFISKCVLWVISNVYSKLVQFSELKILSLTDICVSSLGWISKWLLSNIIMKFWICLENYSHIFSVIFRRDLLDNLKLLMNNLNLNHLNANIQLLELHSKKV